MLAMFARAAKVPKTSFFLFGPRGTGKTTWLKEQIPNAVWFDLLYEREQLRLLRAPHLFTEEVLALPRKKRWIVLDEIQRVPALLDEIQGLLSRAPSRWKFAITGSSARKLRRGGGNLLPGRVVNRRFFPLTSTELGDDAGVASLLLHGGLPAVRRERSGAVRDEMLRAYVENYLTQEIRLEAAAKHLDAFARFLEVAAIANAQVTNVASVARDASVARPTVQGYFEVLVDTLVGNWLPAWRPRAKIKESAHPKFYFFDTGVVRAMGGRAGTKLEEAERGPLLETWIHHELRAHIDRTGCGGSLSYWRTPSGSEVDFVWSRGAKNVAIEVKATERWRPEHGRALESLLEERAVSKGMVVYLGDRTLRVGRIDVLPFPEFVLRLGRGDVIG